MLPSVLIVAAAAACLPSVQPEPAAPAPVEAAPDSFARTAAKISAADLAGATMQGVGILLKMQSGEGNAEWPYEGVYRVRREIPYGYRIGGTAIAVLALLEAPGLADDTDRREAIARGLGFVAAGTSHADMSEEKYDAGYDVRGWGYIYGLHVLVRAKGAGAIPAAQAEACDAAAAWYLDALQKIEMPRTGGWNYARPEGRATLGAPSTFMTAPALQALFDARAAGMKVDDGVVDRAIGFLEKARNVSGSVQYSGPAAETERRMEATPGAVGRMMVTNATLLMAGRGSLDDLRGSLDAFIVHWDWLNIRRAKTGTHVAPYQIAPYYFMFAHRYAAQAIELLPERERGEYRRRVNGLLFSVRDEDGRWNDRVFDRSAAYGTAMAMLAINEPAGTKVSAWTPAKAP